MGLAWLIGFTYNTNLSIPSEVSLGLQSTICLTDEILLATTPVDRSRELLMFKITGIHCNLKTNHHLDY